MAKIDRKAFLDILHQAKYAVTLMLGGILGVFALQNMASVELTFLFWTFESRRIVVIGISLFVGLAIGWIAGFSFARR